MSDYPVQLTVTTSTNVEELAEAVKDAIHDHDQILTFVLRLDELVADYDFTVSLRDALSAAITKEDEAGE